MPPSAELAEAKRITTSAPDAGVVPSARTSRPVTVPLAERMRFCVRFPPGAVSSTEACAPWVWEKAASFSGPTGILAKAKRPSTPAMTVSFWPENG